MKVRKMLIKDIYNDEIIYQVPYYQRYYEWDKINIIQLLDDISDVLKEIYKTKLTHFLGMLVLRKFNDRDKIEKYEIIDGQQRLTSLFLIFKSLNVYYNWLMKNEEVELFDISKLKISNMDMKKLKLILSNEDMDDSTLETITYSKINSKHLNSSSSFNEFIQKYLKEIKQIKKTTKLFKNFKFTLEWFDKSKLNKDKLIEFKNKFLDFELAIIEINKMGDNPQNIFESINSKSKKLENIDLIKNYIFMNIPLNEEQESLYASQWLKLESTLSKKELNQFFKFVVMLKNNEYIEEKDLGIFKAFKNTFSIFDLKTAKECLNDLMYWCDLYITGSRKISKEQYKDKLIGFYNLIKHKNYIFEKFMSNRFSDYPILFSMFILDEVINEKINFSEFRNIINIVDAYIIRWNLCSNKGNLSKPLLDICKDIKNKEGISKEQIVKSTIQALTGQFKYFLNEELEVALKYNPISKKNARCIIRYYWIWF